MKGGDKASSPLHQAIASPGKNSILYAMSPDKLIINSLRPYLPAVKSWINTLLGESSLVITPLADLKFKRLVKYYSPDFLAQVKIVIVDQIPRIPLHSMGLFQLSHFENLDAVGITYLNTIFIRSDYKHEEWLYFHELVHVLQWREFGYDDFLLAYGLGLIKYQHNYSLTPFERMAYGNDALFRHSDIVFNVEAKLLPEIKLMKEEVGELGR